MRGFKGFWIKGAEYLQHERPKEKKKHKNQWVGTGSWKTGSMGNHVPDRVLIPGLLGFHLELLWFATELIFSLCLGNSSPYSSFFLDYFVFVHQLTHFVFQLNETEPQLTCVFPMPVLFSKEFTSKYQHWLILVYIIAAIKWNWFDWFIWLQLNLTITLTWLHSFACR